MNTMQITHAAIQQGPATTAARASLAAATILTGLSAGFFFTYQVSVIRGLAIVDDATYVSTFQAINDTIRNGWFGLVFFGAVPALIAALATGWGDRVNRWSIGIALLSYLAVVAITFAGNVPLNQELATAATNPQAALIARTQFEASWNSLHLARTLLAVVSLVALAWTTSRSSVWAPTNHRS